MSLGQPREVHELVQAARFPLVDVGQGYSRDSVGYRIAMRRLEMAADAFDGTPEAPDPRAIGAGAPAAAQRRWLHAAGAAHGVDRRHRRHHAGGMARMIHRLGPPPAQARDVTPDRIAEHLEDLDARLAALDAERDLILQIRSGLVRLLDFHAGAPDGAGKRGASVAAEGGASRSNLKPEARTEPGARTTPADGVSAPVASRVPSRRRSDAGDGVDRESAPTAEGSTRTLRPAQDAARRASAATRARGPFLCADCDRVFPLPQGLARHRGAAHASVSPARPPAVSRAAPFEVELDVDEPSTEDLAPAVRREPWVPAPVVPVPAQPPSGPTSYLCERCQEPYPTPQALAEHRRDHPEVPRAFSPMRRAGSTLDQALQGR